jgi:outer membrane protein OmpU
VAKLHHPPRLCRIAARKSCQNGPKKAKPLSIPTPDSPVWAYELKTEGKTMKKILFATTALIATASVAAADVRLSGYGRFGLDYNQNNDRVGNVSTGALNGRSSTNITSRLRLQVDMSTETDNGVAFGARFRAQAESRDNAPGGAGFNGARFFASYEGFTLQVGNIVGAVENMPGLYLETRTADIGIDGAGFESIVANVNGESFNWDAYSSGGTGANGVEVIYSANGFTGHISYSADNGPAQISGLITEQDARVGAMVAYNFGDWTAALALQSSDRAFEDKAVLSVSGNIGQFGVRLAYADNDGVGKFGIYGNMDIGAASNVLVYVTSEDAVSAADVAAGRNNNVDGAIGSNNREGTGYGIHYSYDLGGGVSFEAGARQASWENTTAQAGVYFSF